MTIELPDDQAMVLKLKAAAQGLTLEDWFRKLANTDTPTQPAPQGLVEFFRNSPLVGLELGFERDRDPGRDIVL